MSMTCKNNLVGYLFSLWFLFHIKYCQLGPKCVPDARWFYEVIPLGSLGWVGLDVSWLRLLERFLSLMVTAQAGEHSSWRVCRAPWQVVLGRGLPSEFQWVAQVLWFVLSPPRAKFLIIMSTPSFACLEKRCGCLAILPSSLPSMSVVTFSNTGLGLWVFSVRVVSSLVNPECCLIWNRNWRSDTLSSKNKNNGRKGKGEKEEEEEEKKAVFEQKCILLETEICAQFFSSINILLET